MGRREGDGREQAGRRVSEKGGGSEWREVPTNKVGCARQECVCGGKSDACPNKMHTRGISALPPFSWEKGGFVQVGKEGKIVKVAKGGEFLWTWA